MSMPFLTFFDRPVPSLFSATPRLTL